MLLLPYLASVAVVGPTWAHLPLLGAWLTGYLLSYYAFLSLKSRRPRRYRAQLLAYTGAAVALGLPLLALRPAVLWYAPAYALLLAVNAGFAWWRRERALVNDLASVAQSCVMVFVVTTVAGQPPANVAGVFAAVATYFVGTVLYVKTMIRERDNVVYRWASVGYHALALGLMAWLSLALGAVFTLLLLRAWALPGRGLAPARVGAIEIVLSALLLAVTVLGHH